MKKIIKNCIVLLLLVSLSSCYSLNSISSMDFKKQSWKKISGFETKEGVVVKQEEKLNVIKNLEWGVVLIDSTGIKSYKYEDLKSVLVNETDSVNTILVIFGIVVGTVLLANWYLSIINFKLS